MSNYKHFRKNNILVRVVVVHYIALCLFDMHARGGARSEPSLWD